ncbi:TOS1 protein [Xylariomycetidae sp. FL2044]|nr:TOS1 protein [Xylariomycetidae sp. FL2044]
MKYAAALIVGSAAVASAGYCANAVLKGGNYYCPGSGVSQIKYDGLDIPGTYKAVDVMDNTGTCTFKDQAYSGPIAPFDEGLAMVFRGPLQLAEFAVYHPSTSSSKKRDVPKAQAHSKRHGHQHLHKKHHEQEKQKREDVWVTATIDGQVQSWINDWFGPSTADAAAATAAATTTAAAATTTAVKSTGSSSSSSSSSSSDSDDTITTDFSRSAYYNAEDQTADGLVFLANKGSDSVSGTWDTVWGNSVSYVNEDGTECAASPTVLGNVQLGDMEEIMIFSDKECDNDCGTVRPGSVAYHGFEGATKVFIAKFTMPMSGVVEGDLSDAPAYWMLNAAIPRTGQYSTCSCWAGGQSSPQDGSCGEADIVEILETGETRAKSTFHFANGIGDSHWFERPTEKPMTIAVVFQASTATASIKVLDSFDFATGLSADQVDDMVADEKDINLLSLMTFGLLGKE